MENKILEVQSWLESNKINFIKDFDLTRRSWIKAGGKIKTYIKPNNLDEIIKINNFAKEKKVKTYVIGNISNTLIRDGQINTPFINLSNFNYIIKLKNKSGLHVFVGAGVSIPRFSKYVVDEGYSGTEGLYGIPGTIGGGIFMNASSFGNSLTESMHKVVAIDLENKVSFKKINIIKFSWRYSEFQDTKNIIIGAFFFFPKEKMIKKEKIRQKFNDTIIVRKKFQESNFPNLGSLFATKNIYSDLKFNSIIFFFMFILNKIINLIFYKSFFRDKYLLYMRTLINKLYIKVFKLDNKSYFSLSNKTINCLINKGSHNSNEGIELIRRYQKITNDKVKLENIILDKIL